MLRRSGMTDQGKASGPAKKKHRTVKSLSCFNIKIELPLDLDRELEICAIDLEKLGRDPFLIPDCTVSQGQTARAAMCFHFTNENVPHRVDTMTLDNCMIKLTWPKVQLTTTAGPSVPRVSATPPPGAPTNISGPPTTAQDHQHPAEDATKLELEAERVLVSRLLPMPGCPQLRVASASYGQALILEMRQPKRNMCRIFSCIANLPDDLSKATVSTHFRNDLGLPLLARRQGLVATVQSLFVNFSFAVGHPVEEKRQLTMVHGSPGAGKSFFLNQFLRAFLSDAIVMEMFLKNDLSLQSDDLPQLCWDLIVRGLGNSMPSELYLRARFLNALFAALIGRMHIAANIGLMLPGPHAQDAQTSAHGVVQSTFLMRIAGMYQELQS
ncbi:hypothetical protein BC832DRAFT_607409, partial [Gaertneriomyces semiglobifer]